MTAKLAHRLVQTFGVICSHPSLQPPPEIGPFEERTPFSPRDRTNLASGIRLHLRRPKSDGRATFEHYTMRRLRAIIDAAAERDLGPEVSAELLTALSRLIRHFKLEREYKIALLKRQAEWPALPPDNPNARVQLRYIIRELYDPEGPLPDQKSAGAPTHPTAGLHAQFPESGATPEGVNRTIGEMLRSQRTAGSRIRVALIVCSCEHMPRSLPVLA